MKPFYLCAFADEAGASLKEQIAALKENEISLVELRAIDGKNHTSFTIREMKDVCHRLKEEGIKIWSLGSPIGKIDISEQFEPHLELFCHTLELANVAEAKNIRLFSFYMPSEDASAHQEEVIRRLGAMTERASNSGITLCHENEKGIFGDIPERCRILHEALPGLKAVFDPANFVQCGADIVEAWTLLAPYVEYLHIKDAKKDGEIVPAGLGAGNIPWLIGEYEKRQGQVLTLEPHLFQFAGLDSLEKDGEKSVIGQSYESPRHAFDCGVSALRKIGGYTYGSK